MRSRSVCAPRTIAGACGLCELLAMAVRAIEATEGCSVARAGARDEESHLLRRVLGEQRQRGEYREDGHVAESLFGHGKLAP
jgi:hypothetical protein